MNSPRSEIIPKKQVAIIGSLNLDYVTRVEALPNPGETVLAHHLTRFRGGKGANQAIAAARQGCKVILFGAVGQDEAGASYLEALESEGIVTQYIRKVPAETGAAFITVDEAGENTIVVAPGANAELRKADISRHAEVLKNCEILLAQFEVPAAPLLDAVHLANRLGIKVVINPSPFNPTFPWHEIRTDFIVVNEQEAIEMFGFLPSEHTLAQVCSRLTELRATHLILTRGEEETAIFSQHGEHANIPVLPVLPVDTVGAGDAFTGCFVARLAQGESLFPALEAANCAGALTTLGNGAQTPIPNREQVDRHIAVLKSKIT